MGKSSSKFLPWVPRPTDGGKNRKQGSESPKVSNPYVTRVLPKPPVPPPKPNILRALFSYTSSGDGDLTVQAGDLMKLVDDSNVDWSFVELVSNGKQGYVPKNYVAKPESVEIEEWYAGNIARMEAEKLLNDYHLANGTFLIRARETEENSLALTVKFAMDADDDRAQIRNYKIRKANGIFFISPKWQFVTLQELVKFYRSGAHGLCCQLTDACPKIAERLWDLSPKTQENYEIPREDLRYIRLIGKGFFGEVWHAKWKERKDIAVKMLKVNSGMSRESFLDEAKIMKSCRHKNLVSLLGVCTIGEPICILTEYMSKGNLLEYLKSVEGKCTQFNVLIDICAQIAKGMSYLELQRIVHRDLAARNILVGDKEGHVPSVRVADFGLAKIFNEEYAVYVSQPGGKLPIKWTAPEALMYNRFSTKSDVWSYGILLYEIFTRGQTPYPGMTGGEVVDKLRDNYRMPCPEGCPQPFYEVMKRCWAQNPDERDTFEYLFTFFDDYVVSAQSAYYPA